MIFSFHILSIIFIWEYQERMTCCTIKYICRSRWARYAQVLQSQNPSNSFFCLPSSKGLFQSSHKTKFIRFFDVIKSIFQWNSFHISIDKRGNSERWWFLSIMESQESHQRPTVALSIWFFMKFCSRFTLEKENRQSSDQSLSDDIWKWNELEEI